MLPIRSYGYIMRYNTPCSLRLSVGVLYDLDNCEVELYNVLQISFLVYSEYKRRFYLA